MAFDVAREYKEHVDSIKRDRQLEEWLEVGKIEPPIVCRVVFLSPQLCMLH